MDYGMQRMNASDCWHMSLAVGQLFVLDSQVLESLL